MINILVFEHNFLLSIPQLIFQFRLIVLILIMKLQIILNAAVIIDGPEGVLNSKDVNKPINTDNKPPIIE